MKSKFKRVVRTNCIAVDAVALITNKENPVDQLSLQEIGDILSGKISRWSQLAGSDTTAIKIVFDNPGSSTVSYMRHQFLPAGTQVSDNPNAFGQKNNAQVLDLVKKDPNALGIISVSWLGEDLSAAKNIPLDRRVEDYNVLHSFYTFITGFAGQKIITKTGILPFHFPQRVVNLQ